MCWRRCCTGRSSGKQGSAPPLQGGEQGERGDTLVSEASLFSERESLRMQRNTQVMQHKTAKDRRRTGEVEVAALQR